MKKKTLLSRNVRISVMISLIVSFFVISPLIILYTMGYRYDIRSGIVKETGVLSVDVEPETAQVVLNGNIIEKGMPMRVPDLIPGTYTISITQDGYHPWEKDISIEKIQTTYIKDIELFKQSDPVRHFEHLKGFREISWSHDGRYALVSSEKEEKNILTLVQTASGEMAEITSSTGGILFSWSPFFNDAIITTQSEDGYIHLQLFDAENGSLSFETQFDKTPSDIQWSPNAGIPTVFFQDEQTREVRKLSAVNTSTLGIATISQWYIDDNEILWEVDAAGKRIEHAEKETLTLSEKTIDKILYAKGNIWIAEKNQKILVFRRHGDTLDHLVTLPTDQIRYNANTKEWITWSPWEVWNIYDDGSVALLNRTSERIDEVWPMDEFGVLMIRRENAISGFNPGYFLEHTLLDNVHIIHAGIDIDQRTIHFWGTVDDRDGIWKMKY